MHQAAMSQSYTPSQAVADDAARKIQAQSIVARIGANRGWISRIRNEIIDDVSNPNQPIKGLIAQYKDAHAANTQREISRLSKKLSRLPQSLENIKGSLDLRYEELAAVDPAGQLTRTISGQGRVVLSYSDANTRDVRQCDDLIDVIEKALEDCPTGTSGSASSALVKPVQSLMPSPLEEGTAPPLFLAWKDQFKSYYDSSNLQYAKLTAQQGHLRSCLSLEVQSRLFKQIKSTTPIFSSGSEESCTSLLDKLWELQFPLSKLRLAYWDLKQEPGESGDALMERLKEHRALAKLTNINQTGSANDNDLLVLKYLHAVTDSKFRDYLLDESCQPGSDLKKFEARIAQYVAKQAQQSGFNSLSKESRGSGEARSYTVRTGNRGQSQQSQ